MKYSLLLLLVVVIFLGSAGSILASEVGIFCATDSDCPLPGDPESHTKCDLEPSRSTPGCYCNVPDSGLSTCGGVGDGDGGGGGGDWGDDGVVGFGINLLNPLCGGSSTICANDFPTLITKITGYIFDIMKALAVLMLVWAGILFVTAAGKADQIEKAKKALFWALIGAAIALAGDGLIAFVKVIIGEPPS